MAKNETCSWQNINQKLPARVVTGRGILKFVVTAVVVALAIGAIWQTRKRYFPQLQKPPQPLKKVYFQSDGTLSAKWVFQRYPLKMNMDLMKIDIHRYKKNLESYAQIKSAQIKRKFPNAIQIRISEYKPISKICVQQKGQKKVLLVSAEGQIFEPYGYSKETIKPFPWIVGYPLKLHNHRWQPISNFKKISALLNEIQKNSPKFFNQIDCISLTKLDNSSAPWCSVSIVTTEKKQMKFSLKTPKEQILKFNSIASRLSPEEWKDLKSIDLSLKNPVLQFNQILKRR